MHIAHLLRRQHRACAHQHIGIGGAHGGNAAQRVGRIQRHLPQAKATGVQRGADFYSFGRLQAAQNGDQRQLRLQGLKTGEQIHDGVPVRYW
ncbi:hypothetical protein D3C72_1857730 [compost metagenome]